MELRGGDRIRWTRNDADLGLMNSHAAEVTAVHRDRVSFLLEDGRRLDLRRDHAQLRHVDHAWASTVHAFQGRTVDNVIAVMEANHPHLTTQKSFYVEISRARHRAELVTDDAKALCDRLEAATGERVSALEGVAAAAEAARSRKVGKTHTPEAATVRPGREAGVEPQAPPVSPTRATTRVAERTPERTQPPAPARAPEPESVPRPAPAPQPARAPEPSRERAPKQIEYELELEL